MITVGDTTTTLQLVQVLKGVGSALDGEPVDSVWVLDIAQWEPAGDYFCEFQNDPNGDCDSGSVSWGTSDPFEPKFCTKHFFDGNMGYDLVEVV
jgi:hypothetical protein